MSPFYTPGTALGPQLVAGSPESCSYPPYHPAPLSGLIDWAQDLDILPWQESLPITLPQNRGSRYPSLTCSCWDLVLASYQPSLAPVQENWREELAKGQEELQEKEAPDFLVVGPPEGWLETRAQQLLQ